MVKLFRAMEVVIRRNEKKNRPDAVAQAYNPTYSVGRDREDMEFSIARPKSSPDPILANKLGVVVHA
jgi:hypothetical protein